MLQIRYAEEDATPFVLPLELFIGDKSAMYLPILAAQCGIADLYILCKKSKFLFVLFSTWSYSRGNFLQA